MVATVVYLGRNQQKVDDVLAVAQQISADCMGLTADVLDEEKLSMAYERIMNQYGRIDALINGAGGNMPGATVGPRAGNFLTSILMTMQK